MSKIEDYLVTRLAEIKQALKDSYAIIETDGDDYVWQKYRNHITTFANGISIPKEDLQNLAFSSSIELEIILYDEIVKQANTLWNGHRKLLAQLDQSNTVLIVHQYPHFVMERTFDEETWNLKCRWRAAMPLMKNDGWQTPEFELPF